LAESLTDQIGAAAAGAVVALSADCREDLLVDKNITLDLNGCSILGAVTVVDGCTLTVKDSATDDFTVADAEGYGKLEAVSGTVKAASGYLEIREADGVSFHKVELQLTTVTLRPETVGIYYTGEFKGDQVVAANVDAFGIALRLDKAPDAAYMGVSSACSRYYDFTAGEAGNTATGTLLKNVMRKGRPLAENKTNSQKKIYGSAYIRTVDGQYYFGTGVSKTFMKVMQEAESQWKSLTKAQRNELEKLYTQFESIMDEWNLPNLQPGDIDIPI
jgi:hypothetical protein